MKFSIIIPVCNVAPYLRACLDSVLGQTYADWEAICVDDGSTDGSGAILDEYAKRDARFCVVHQENAGVSLARNNALTMARGEYIGFLDADDAIVPDWLENARRLTEDGKADLVRLSKRDWDGSVDVVSSACSGSVGTARYEGCECRERAYSHFLSEGWLWLSFIRRTMLERAQARFLPGLRLREDMLFLVQVSRTLNSIVFSSCPGYLYRRTGASACSKVKRVQDKYLFLSGLLSAVLDDREFMRAHPKVWQALDRQLLDNVVELVAEGDPAERKNAGCVVEVLRAFIRQGCLKTVPLRWRAAQWMLSHGKTLNGYVATQKSIELFRNLKRRCHAG